MNRHVRIPGGVAALTVTAACALFMESPSVRIAEVRVTEIGLRGATAEIAVDISNPNGFTLTSAGLDYRLSFAEGGSGADGTAWRVLAEGVSRDSASVPGNETRQVALSVPFLYEDVGRAVEQFRQTGGLRYRLTGGVRFDAPLRDVRVPFEETGTMGS